MKKSKILLGLFSIMLVLVMMCSPVVVETVKAEEQVKIALTYCYRVDGAEVDLGRCGNLMMPASYTQGSQEACEFVASHANEIEWIAEYCAIPGVSITAEYNPTAEQMGMYPTYAICFDVSTSSSSEEMVYEPVPVEQDVVLPGGEEVRMISDSPYVYVIGDPEVLPTGTTFDNSQITVGAGYDLPVAAVEKYVGADLEVAVYQMDLTSAEGVAITQLGDYINVTLPIPADITLDEGKTIVMYRYEDNGTLTRCDTVVDENMVTFATNHFSFYVMVEQDASAGPSLVRGTSSTSAATSPKTADMSMIPVMMTAISGMGIAVMAMKKKNEI